MELLRIRIGRDRMPICLSAPRRSGPDPELSLAIQESTRDAVQSGLSVICSSERRYPRGTWSENRDTSFRNGG